MHRVPHSPLPLSQTRRRICLLYRPTGDACTARVGVPPDHGLTSMRPTGPDPARDSPLAGMAARVHSRCRPPAPETSADQAAAEREQAASTRTDRRVVAAQWCPAASE